MGRRAKLTAPAAAGAIALAGAVWYFGKTPEFRRDPLTEAAAVLRIAAIYQASYEDCADERYERDGVTGLAHAFAGRATHDFPAMNDTEAVAFARAALPACRLDFLMRKRRFAWTRSQRIDRIPVDIGTTN